MEQGKFWVLINPTAGKGSAGGRRPEIERFLGRSGRDFEVLATEGPGDALAKVRSLPLRPEDTVIAAGGDGTCNEVANGLLARDRSGGDLPAMGVLPIGRGNDFAFALGIPENAEDALKLVLEKEARPMDVGLVKGGFFPEGRHFLNGMGVGFDTKVGFAANRLKMKSDFSYVIGVLSTLIRYEMSPELLIRYDDREVTMPAVLVSIMNGRRMGGGFYMGPNAKIDDGLFDICFVEHQSSRLKLIRIISHYFKGTQLGLKGVHSGRAVNFRLKALRGSMAAHCDGETVCEEGTELEVSCIPAALRVIGA